MMASPFLKWAGGKRQLIEDIESRLPGELGTDGNRRYAEPFVGSGVLMFHLFEKELIDDALISDLNKDLVNAYRTIREDVSGVISCLESIQERYDESSQENRKESYFSIRKEFNDRRATFDYDSYSTDWCLHSAQMIYLNKTGFNGLFRVNKSGHFNVPPSDLKNKTILNEENLLDVSRVLQNVEIRTGDFSECSSWVEPGSFVYFDPPYRPIEKTSFTTYSTNVFDDSEQERLANFAKELCSRGVRVMVSNSDPTNTDAEDDYFERIYSSADGFSLHKVNAIRSINSKGGGRGPISELLITNY